MNRYTGETLKKESDHIKQSIADILLTPVGSRIQRWEPRVQITQFKPELVEGGIVASYVARGQYQQHIKENHLLLGHKS